MPCTATGSGSGYPNAFYDPYNQPARDIYSRQIIDGIASKGFDAWWLDSDEPDFHSNLSIAERQRRMGPTALGPGAAYFNSYPLVHVEHTRRRGGGGDGGGGRGRGGEREGVGGKIRSPQEQGGGGGREE